MSRKDEVQEISQWYALRTRSRHEKMVRDRLGGIGVEHFLPTVMRVSRWKDRKMEVEFPLFPGYCFARFPWQEKLRVLMISGEAGNRRSPGQEGYGKASLRVARIIHERSVFVNNAPAGAGSAAPAGFDPAAAAGLKASPERRPANAGRSRSPEGRLFTSM